MDDQERENLTRLHRECTSALERCLEQGSEMCRLLSAITSHPASPQERQALLKQRIKEYDAQKAYNSVREQLFKLAGWE